MSIFTEFFSGSKTQSTPVSQTIRQDTDAARKAAERKKRLIAANNQGNQATILTSPVGVAGPASVLSPNLGGV